MARNARELGVGEQQAHGSKRAADGAKVAADTHGRIAREDARRSEPHAVRETGDDEALVAVVKDTIGFDDEQLQQPTGRLILTLSSSVFLFAGCCLCHHTYININIYIYT